MVLKSFPYGRCIGLLTTLALVASAAWGQQPKPFTTLARDHFARWDLNHDGRLDDNELQQRMTDPSVRDDDAACAATLEHYAGPNTKTPVLWTLKVLDQIDDGAARHVKEVTGDDGKVIPVAGCMGLFRAFKHRLQVASRDFYPNQAPHLEKIQQGANGDCYFLAVVGAMLARNAEDVRALMRPETDGSAQVDLASGQHFNLPPATDGEIAAYDDCPGDGVWLLQLDKAFGMVRQTTDQKYLTMDSESVSGQGGSCTWAFKVLTGGKMREYAFSHDGSPAPGHVSVERVRSLLTEATQHHRLMTIITGGPQLEPRPPGVPGGHCLALLGFETRTDRVRLWNPWGNTRRPQSSDPTPYGYATEHGLFYMPVPDLMRYCQDLDVETTDYGRFE